MNEPAASATSAFEQRPFPSVAPPTTNSGASSPPLERETTEDPPRSPIAPTGPRLRRPLPIDPTPRRKWLSAYLGVLIALLISTILFGISFALVHTDNIAVFPTVTVVTDGSSGGSSAGYPPVTCASLVSDEDARALLVYLDSADTALEASLAEHPYPLALFHHLDRRTLEGWQCRTLLTEDDEAEFTFLFESFNVTLQSNTAHSAVLVTVYAVFRTTLLGARLEDGSVMPLPSFKVQLGLRIGGLLVRVLSAVAVLGAIFFQLRHARQLANSPAPTEVAAPRAAPAQQVWQCGTRPFPGFELEESPYGLTTYTERKGDQEVAAADEKTVFGQELDITEEELREAEEEQRREEGLRLPAVPSADLLSDRSYEGTSRSLCGVVLEDGGSRKLAILRLRHQKRTRIFIIVFMVVQIITFIAGVANIVLTFALDGIEFSTGGVHIQSSYSMDKSAVIGVSCAFVIFAFLVCWAIYQRKMF